MTPDTPTAEELAESQAALNEYLAYMITSMAFNERRYVARALAALANHNLASGFEAGFAGEKPPDDPAGRELYARAAVRDVQSMDVMSRWDAARARLEAGNLRLWGTAESAADGAALVYLITHAELGAAKVGTADTSGLRLAQHRREGWRILAAFEVAAKRAAAIEREILEGWRGAGLPSFLTRSQMPQGGWTETAALGHLDLGATVTRLCKLAVAAPRALSDPRPVPR